MHGYVQQLPRFLNGQWLEIKLFVVFGYLLFVVAVVITVVVVVVAVAGVAVVVVVVGLVFYI